MRTLVLLLSLVATLTSQEATQPKSLIFTVTIGGGDVGEETATLTKTGWTSKGAFDIFGTRQGDYTASRINGDGVDFTFNYAIKTGGRDIKIQGIRAGDEIEVSLEGRVDKAMVKVPKEAPVFAFENLLWAPFIDLGRIISAHEKAGTLEDDMEIAAASVAGATPFSVTHRSSRTEQQSINGKVMTLRISRISLPPAVGVRIVATLDGLPLRIDIPDQQVTAKVKGFEDLRGAAPKPTSIVDSGPWRERLSKPDHEVVVDKGVMIPMSDGVKLAADIYRPKGKGPFPTILTRTPYNRKTEGGIKGKHYAKRGYVLVAQDVRGRFDSEGDWFPFTSEEKDGSDTIDWIASQPWSDDQVGMIGASYVGLVQWLAAKSGNPKLKCIVPQVSPPDPHENFPYEGGAFLLGAAWWARVLDSMKQGTNWQSGLDWENAYKALPLLALEKAMKLKEPSTFLKTWLEHPPHDVAFWDHAIYQNRFGTMDLPTFNVTGWYDGDMPGALMNYAGMKAGAKTERARNSQYLVVGPWTHLFNTASKIGEKDFGPEGRIDLDARILRFFDRYLKNIDNGIEREPHVHVFTMGSNQWHGHSEWPIEGTQFHKLHLTSGGNAAKRDGDGRLTLQAPSGGAASETYRYDPMDLPELDLDFTDMSGAQATEDHSDLEDRKDDLTYTSAPLATACDIVGPINVKLWVSTDAKDTDFMASFHRITKDGARYTLRGGVQRLRYAADPQKDTPVPPGKVVPITIDLWATGERFGKGDRIQIEVSSHAWPGYARNLNTLAPQATAKDAVVAANTVHQTKQYPSHLILPVVPRDGAPGLSFEKK